MDELRAALQGTKSPMKSAKSSKKDKKDRDRDSPRSKERGDGDREDSPINAIVNAYAGDSGRMQLVTSHPLP